MSVFLCHLLALFQYLNIIFLYKTNCVGGKTRPPRLIQCLKSELGSTRYLVFYLPVVLNDLGGFIRFGLLDLRFLPYGG